jgi:hypothetical protein
MPDDNDSFRLVNGQSENQPEFLWGADAIAEAIGRTPRQAFHLISTGALRSVQKKGGRWVALRSKLLEEFGAAP